LLVRQGAARVKIGLSRSESINHRHADFQFVDDYFKPNISNRLPGQSLGESQDDVELCGEMRAGIEVHRSLSYIEARG